MFQSVMIPCEIGFLKDDSMFVGIIIDGEFSPANPALIKPEPLSRTIACSSPIDKNYWSKILRDPIITVSFCQV
jgi:hypothetical protein